MTWNTYRKKLTHIVSVNDGSKGWIRMVVEPTMRHYGYTANTCNDIDLDKRKPLQILREDYKDIIDRSSELIYHIVIPTGAYAGYYKYLDIYYKEKIN